MSKRTLSDEGRRKFLFNWELEEINGDKDKWMKRRGREGGRVRRRGEGNEEG